MATPRDDDEDDEDDDGQSQTEPNGEDEEGIYEEEAINISPSKKRIPKEPSPEAHDGSDEDHDEFNDNGVRILLPERTLTHMSCTSFPLSMPISRPSLFDTTPGLAPEHRLECCREHHHRLHLVEGVRRLHAPTLRATNSRLLLMLQRAWFA